MGTRLLQIIQPKLLQVYKCTSLDSMYANTIEILYCPNLYTCKLAKFKFGQYNHLKIDRYTYYLLPTYSVPLRTYTNNSAIFRARDLKFSPKILKKYFKTRYENKWPKKTQNG